MANLLMAETDDEFEDTIEERREDKGRQNGIEVEELEEVSHIERDRKGSKTESINRDRNGPVESNDDEATRLNENGINREEYVEEIEQSGTGNQPPMDHHVHGEDEPLPKPDRMILEDSETIEDNRDREASPERDEQEEVYEAEIRKSPQGEDEAEEPIAQTIEVEYRQSTPQLDTEEKAESEEKTDQIVKPDEEDVKTAVETFEEVMQQTTAPEPVIEIISEEKRGLDSEIHDVFKLFDYETNDSIDLKDLGNVLRCMQLNPTEAEVKILMDEVITLIPERRFLSEDGKISWSNFLPKVTEIVENERFKPSSEDELITAFSLLDTDKKGFLTVEQLRNALLKFGEPLNEEEFEEMLSAASDFDSDCFNYVEYAKLLVCN